MQKGIPFKVREIFKEPLSEGEIRGLLAGRPTEELLAKRSPRFKALNLGEKPLTQEEMLHLMAQEPALIRRPIITRGQELVIGLDPKGLDALFP